MQEVLPENLSTLELKALGFEAQNSLAFYQNQLAIITAELNKRSKEENATQEGEKPEGSVSEHTERAEGGETTEASSGNSPVGSGQESQA